MVFGTNPKLMINPTKGTNIPNQEGQPGRETFQKILRLLLVGLLFSSVGSNEWELDSTTEGTIAREITKNALEPHQNILPVHFYNGKSPEDSYCSKAYSEMPKLCAMASGHDRALLGTLLANCHLESLKENTIRWDPVHHLKHVTKEQFSFISGFILFIPETCIKFGYGHQFAHLQLRFQRDEKLWNSLNDLSAAVKMGSETYLDLRAETDLYRERSAKLVERSAEVLRLGEDLQSAVSSLSYQQKQLKEIHGKIGLKITDYIGEKYGSKTMLKDYTEQAKLQVEEIGQKLRIQKDYNELQRNFTDVLSQLTEVKGEGARCRRLLDDAKNSINPFKRLKNVLSPSKPRTRVWTGAFRRILWSSLYAPFRVSRLLYFLGSIEMLGHGARFIIFMVQAVVSLVSVSIIFKMLLFAKALIDNGNEIRGLISSMLNIFVPSSQPSRLYQERSATEEQSERGADRSKDGEQLNERAMRKLISRIERRLESCFRRELEEMRVDKLFSSQVEEEGRMYTQKLVSRIARVETRQIHLIQALQAAEGLPRPEHTHPRGKVELIESSEESTSGMKLRSSRRARQNQ